MAGSERIILARGAALEAYRRTLERAASASVQVALRDDGMFVDSGFLCLERGGHLPAAAHWDPDGFAVLTERATIYHDRYGTTRIGHNQVAAIRRSWRPSPLSVKVALLVQGKHLRFAAPHIFSKDWIGVIRTYGRKDKAAALPEKVRAGKARILLTAPGVAVPALPGTNRETGSGWGYLLEDGSFTFVTARRVEWEIGSSSLKEFAFRPVMGRLGLLLPLSEELSSISIAPPVGQVGAWVRVWAANGMRET